MNAYAPHVVSSTAAPSSNNPTALETSTTDNFVSKKLKFIVHDFFENKTESVGSNKLNDQLQSELCRNVLSVKLAPARILS